MANLNNKYIASDDLDTLIDHYGQIVDLQQELKLYESGELTSAIVREEMESVMDEMIEDARKGEVAHEVNHDELALHVITDFGKYITEGCILINQTFEQNPVSVATVLGKGRDEVQDIINRLNEVGEAMLAHLRDITIKVLGFDPLEQEDN